MDNDGYYPIYTRNDAGQRVVDFYFNYSGYQRPAGDLGSNWFWSSSVHPDRSYYAYYLNGHFGVIVSAYRDDDGGAVRCVARR